MINYLNSIDEPCQTGGRSRWFGGTVEIEPIAQFEKDLVYIGNHWRAFGHNWAKKYPLVRSKTDVYCLHKTVDIPFLESKCFIFHQ